ncbi:MAG: hypothetical protein KC776_24125 [Myxococcales bacterium]|nr:hypothetical protein [Myxococcales bacterium]MCB9575446.1 hypothetical protein [Polyangiaceae bacterium]
MAKRVAVLVLLVSVAGCGGAAGNSPPPAKAATEAKEAPAEKPAESSAKADFMAQCEHAPEQHDFCACSFEVASKVLSPEELESRRLPRERERELKAGVIRECAGKFPEPVIKKGFMVGCASQGTGLNGFCACTWETLRKSAEPGEIATMDAGQDSRALGAAKTCMAKMPNQELLANLKTKFLEGCNQEPGYEKFCDCAWGTWSAEMTPAEMILSGPGSKKTRDAVPKIKKACSALAPN